MEQQKYKRGGRERITDLSPEINKNIRAGLSGHNNKLGTYLRIRREEIGLTQQQLAQLSEELDSEVTITNDNISHHESGRAIRRDKIWEYAQILADDNLSAEQIYYEICALSGFYKHLPHARFLQHIMDLDVNELQYLVSVARRIVNMRPDNNSLE